MPSASLLPPDEGVDFEALPWNVNCTEKSVFILTETTTGAFPDEVGENDFQIRKYQSGLADVYPSCTSLNYGTTVWEGLKCFRTQKGRAVVFRPDMNYNRMRNGAENMLLPVPSKKLWLTQLRKAITENSTLIPPVGVGMKLYVRPILFGSGHQLGLYPSPKSSLAMYVAPTGNYFKAAGETGLKLNIEKVHARAMRGGFGAVKCSGNYAVCLLPLKKTKEKGFADNIYLELETFHAGKERDKLSTRDAVLNSVIQEMSAANLFFVQKSKKRILTPSLEKRTILPGVTRDSVIRLVKFYNSEIADAMFGVENSGEKVDIIETDVLVKELSECSEAFATGTAAELVSIRELGEYLTDEDAKDGRPEGDLLRFQLEDNGPVKNKILSLLREIMNEERADEMGWLRDPFGGDDAAWFK
eukprot:g1847.t1